MTKEKVDNPQILPEEKLGILPAGLPEMSLANPAYRRLKQLEAAALMQRIALWDHEPKLKPDQIELAMQPLLSFMAGGREEILHKHQVPIETETFK